MFRLLLPTIIREPQGSTKVTYVFCIYGENGMVTINTEHISNIDDTTTVRLLAAL